MVHYGNGFTVMELYQMPTRLRMFYYNKLADAKKKENEQIEKSNKAASASKQPYSDSYAVIVNYFEKDEQSPFTSTEQCFYKFQNH